MDAEGARTLYFMEFTIALDRGNNIMVYSLHITN